MGRGERRSRQRALGAITDDRGNPCGLAELTPRQLRERALGTSKKSADPISRNEAGLTVVIETGGVIIGLAVGLLLWDRLVSTLIAGWFVPWSNVIVPCVLMLIFGFAFWRVALTIGRQRRWSQVSALFLREGLCAGCGYNLRGCDHKDDGFVVCPECGAAWKQSRLSNKPEEQSS